MPPALVAIVFASAVLHASWNLAAHSHRANRAFFLQLSMAGAAIGAAPAVAFTLTRPPLPPEVWALLAATGVCQALYYFGLTLGYRHGDFSVVYPVARALPVLILAFIDLARGRAPTPAGWLGLLIVFAGCMLAPQVSLRGFSLRRYWNRATVWIAVTALGMVGYTTLDKLAAERMPAGLLSALHYGALEYIVVLPFLWIMLRASERKSGAIQLDRWKWPALAAAFMVTAYWLVLWAYQLAPQSSYVVALRQMSLVIGTVAAVWLFREPGARLRISAAGLITVGVFVIAAAG